MSKTFKVSDITSTGIGDVELDVVGVPELIERREKLVQDVLEILLVMTGTRDVPRSTPNWGSKLMDIMGYPMPVAGLQTLIKGAIDEAIRKLKKFQSTRRNLTEDEKVVKVSSLEVKQRGESLGFDFYLVVSTIAKEEIRIQATIV